VLSTLDSDTLTGFKALVRDYTDAMRQYTATAH
jgi:hypothetical protein